MSARLIARFSRRYLAIDPRSLGLARIAIGLVLLTDLVDRRAWWFDLYSDEGMYPRAVTLSRGGPKSLFLLFGGRTELTLVWVALFVVYLCFCLGLFTRLAQVCAFLAWTGMSQRLPQATNGGYTLLAHFLAFTLVLPLGARFSLDAIRRSLWEAGSTDELARRRAGDSGQTEPVVSIAVLAMQIQVVLVYFLPAILKTGDAWVRRFDAVWYLISNVLYQTPFGAYLAATLPSFCFRVLTVATLLTEFAIPITIVAGGTWGRRMALVLIWLLHLGIGTALLLGPFAWTCCAVATLFVTSSDWDALYRAVARHRLSGRGLAMGRVLARLGSILTALPPRPVVGIAIRTRITKYAWLVPTFLLCVGAAELTWLKSQPNKWPARGISIPLLTSFGDFFGLRQPWHFFAPSPPEASEVVVIDAVTIDGRHVNPVTGGPPRLKLDRPASAEGTPQFVQYMLMALQPNSRAMRPMLDYARNYSNRTGRPEDQIVSVKIYRVTRPIPSIGGPKVDAIATEIGASGGEWRPEPAK
jgi:hypothetical protein